MLDTAFVLLIMVTCLWSTRSSVNMLCLHTCTTRPQQPTPTYPPQAAHSACALMDHVMLTGMMAIDGFETLLAAACLVVMVQAEGITALPTPQLAALLQMDAGTLMALEQQVRLRWQHGGMAVCAYHFLQVWVGVRVVFWVVYRWLCKVLFNTRIHSGGHEWHLNQVVVQLIPQYIIISSFSCNDTGIHTALGRGPRCQPSFGRGPRPGTAGPGACSTRRNAHAPVYARGCRALCFSQRRRLRATMAVAACHAHGPFIGYDAGCRGS